MRRLGSHLRRPALAAMGVTAMLLAGIALSACGEEAEHEVVEGEALELGELRYSVALTRFLNPYDVEDADYVDGPRVPPPAGTQYLGVFLTIANEGEAAEEIADEFTVADTRGNEYEPLETDSVYALEPGRTLEPGEEIPTPDSTAAAGPVKGALLLFEVDTDSTENRPLELEIPGPDDTDGTVELDI